MPHLGRYISDQKLLSTGTWVMNIGSLDPKCEGDKVCKKCHGLDVPVLGNLGIIMVYKCQIHHNPL